MDIVEGIYETGSMMKVLLKVKNGVVTSLEAVIE
jgi:hypothetical protein